jgi:hypothetical protein
MIEYLGSEHVNLIGNYTWCRSVLKSDRNEPWALMPPRPAPAMILRATTRCICPIRR